MIKLKYCLLQEKTHRKQERKSTITRGDYRSLKDLFDSINWETLPGVENLDVQYSKLCETYKKEWKKFISKFKIEARNGPKWFNDKCNVRQPKLFFNYIYSKTKSRVKISANKDNSIIYSKEEEMFEIQK